jgi:hypothetical protein
MDRISEYVIGNYLISKVGNIERRDHQYVLFLVFFFIFVLLFIFLIDK